MRALSALTALSAAFAADPSAEFGQSIRPVLARECGNCHDPAKKSNRVDFLKSESVQDIEARRGMWRGVALQIRNRTMPPVANKLTEQERLHIASWLDNRLRATACSGGEFAGAVPPRRLNRREYYSTIRDLLGVDLSSSDLIPADETGGAGFDTNGETLFLPPMLLERYMEAAQKILDRVIVTPPLNKKFISAEMQPPLPSEKPGRNLNPDEEVSASIPIFLDGDYGLRVSVERPREIPFTVDVKVNGAPMGTLSYQRDSNGGPTARIVNATLEKGVHTVTVRAGKEPLVFYSLTVEQRAQDPAPEKRVLHYRLFGMEPGQAPVNPRAAARMALARFLRRRTGGRCRQRRSTGSWRFTTGARSAAILMKSP